MGFVGSSVEVGKGAVTMRSSKLTRFAGFALGIAGACAFALPSVAVAENADTRFETMDADGDGKDLARRAHRHGDAHVRQMDGNKDDKVTAAEMDAAQQKLLGKKHGRARRAR